MSSEQDKSDELSRADTSDGKKPTASPDPEFARQKALAEEIMQVDGEVLRKLAR